MNELFQKPVEELTADELREAHRILWGFLAANPLKSKVDFFDGFGIEHVPLNECYACVRAGIDSQVGDCDICPCIWQDGDEPVDWCLCGEYGKWLGARDLEHRREAALQVRDAWPEEQSNE
jgi:hypothetical protein